MYEFEITLHVRTTTVKPGPVVTVDGRQVSTIQVPGPCAHGPFPVTFEQAAEILASYPQLFLEPDGSFVWVSPGGQDPAWQVDGHLYDRDERLLYVTLKGSCPPANFDQLLSAVGWPEVTLLFQFVRQAVYLDESQFRRWADRN